jgi:hypothetical protein
MHKQSKADSRSIRERNPDHGPKIHEGEHHYDMGYVSDNDHFSPPDAYPDNHMRGNQYMKHQNEIVERDSKKLYREKFTKIQ